MQPENCVFFCENKEHMSSKCTVITSVETRNNLLKTLGSVFAYFSKN